MTVLLLNASYEPLRVVPRRRALGLLLAGKVDLVVADPGPGVRTSGGATFEAPAVLRLRHMVRVPFRSAVPLSRRAIEARDRRRCQVAGCDRAGQTVDHVVPRSRGGAHEWTNVVLMCTRHNSAKGSRLLVELGWHLEREPTVPRGELVLLARAGLRTAPAAWLPYLPGLANA
ncbi:MAG: HNH endonuclease [Acidobacteria bacterium]|nr:HNH endonuclease [Acidobacteriota bacterium]